MTAITQCSKIYTNVSKQLYFVINRTVGARRHGQGGTCPLWKCCKVFLCISSSSKTLSRPIILHYFHNLLSASRYCHQSDPHRGSITGPCWGTFVTRPIICPPLKLLRAPMNSTIPKYRKHL